jgi:signal peptidase I
MHKYAKLSKWILFVLLLVLLLVKFFLIDFWKVPQNGMYPNIPRSKRFLCKRYPYETVSEIKRGDIIVFKAEWEDGKQYDFIWRVVGLPGESIIIQDKKITINGNDLKLEEVRKEGDYVIYKETNGDAIYEVAYFKKRDHENLKDVQYDIPENHVFVLGDNRDNASDSRKAGTIPFDSIIAKKL